MATSSVFTQECEELQKKYAAQQDEHFLEHTQQQHVLYQQEQQILHQQIQVGASGPPRMENGRLWRRPPPPAALNAFLPHRVCR